MSTLVYTIWYKKVESMLVISSREFRDNQKKYLDLVDQDEHIIIQRGKNKSYVLSPVKEGDEFFMDPKTKAHIQKGIADYQSGRITKVKPEDIDALLGL